MKRWFLIIWIFCTVSWEGRAELRVGGRIVEAETRKGIVATLSIKKNGIKKVLTRCSSTGQFSIQLPADSALLIIENKEYRTVQVPVYGQSGSFYVEIDVYPVDKQAINRPYFQSEQQDLVLNNSGSPASGQIARRQFVLNDLRTKLAIAGEICLFYTKSGRKECFRTNPTSGKSIIEFREDDIVGLVAHAPGYQVYHGNLIISTTGGKTETYNIELDKAPAYVAFSSDIPLEEAGVRLMTQSGKPIPYTLVSPKKGYAAVSPEANYVLLFRSGGEVKRQELAVASGLYLTEIQPVLEPIPPLPTYQVPEGDFKKERLIIFNQSEYTLPLSAYTILDSLAGWLQTHTGFSALVLGHTDNTGDPRRNLTLSEYRARVVVSYLLNHGVHESQLQWQGFGGEQPIASNESEESKARNRRVEIKIRAADDSKRKNKF